MCEYGICVEIVYWYAALWLSKYRELRISAEDTGTLVARHNDSRSVSMGHSSFDVKPQLGVTPNYFQSSRVSNSGGSCMRALCVTQSAMKNGRRRMSHVASWGPSTSSLQRRYFDFQSLETFRKERRESHT